MVVTTHSSLPSPRRQEVEIFRKLEVPTLSNVENPSFATSSCGRPSHLIAVDAPDSCTRTWDTRSSAP